MVVVVLTFNSSLWEVEVGGESIISEFVASLVYRENSGIARTTEETLSPYPHPLKKKKKKRRSSTCSVIIHTKL